MEGLFFEAAGSTPYHFITAAAMSKQSSNPVRELRYDNNDAAKGVRYLQELGVKYFMGFTPEAIAAASGQVALTEVARSGPWVVYRVAQSEIVVPLAVQPVVVDLADNDPRERWLEVGTSWFQQPDLWTTPVADAGPDEWQRVQAVVEMEKRDGEPGSSSRRVDVVAPSAPIAPVALEPVVVSNIDIGQDSINFNVDKVGVPVLVRVSFFPNWKVSGADGPYRVAPNLMVVIPTSTEVSMNFGWSMRDVFAYLLTFAGIVWIVIYRRNLKRFY
jgi:rubredoxin